MKRTLIALLFSLAGLLNVYAQTGNVYRKFYMQTPEQATPDTLLATVSINDGKLSRLDITIPCLDKGVSIVGGLDLKKRPNACSELTDMLKTIKEKYHEWTLIAKNNNIKNILKKLDNIRIPQLYICTLVKIMIRILQSGNLFRMVAHILKLILMENVAYIWLGLIFLLNVLSVFPRLI